MEEGIGPAITTILLVLIETLLPVLLYFVIKWLRAKEQEILGSLTSEQEWLIEQVLESFVRAAEQSGFAGLIENEGRVKKEWALERSRAWLRERGIEIDGELLADRLEAVVEEVKRRYWSESGGDVKAGIAE